MNVGNLRKLIADLPDNMPVVIPIRDHTYYVVEADVVEAVRRGLKNPWEYDEPDGNESRLDVVKVLCIGD